MHHSIQFILQQIINLPQNIHHLMPCNFQYLKLNIIIYNQKINYFKNRFLYCKYSSFRNLYIH